MTTKSNEIPTHGPRGESGSEGPARAVSTGRDPLPPYTSTEDIYRRTWDGFYGEEDYPVETDIDEPRYPIVADIIWGGVIFSTGFLLGIILGSIVGGGVW